MNKTFARLLRVVGWICFCVVLVGVAAVLEMYREYNRPPRVRLINTSGGPVSHIVFKIDTVEVAIDGVLQDGERVQRTVPFRGSEASTEVSWVDKTGASHHAGANDYVEGRGGYLTIVVINPDNTLSQPVRQPPVEPVPRPDRPK